MCDTRMFEYKGRLTISSFTELSPYWNSGNDVQRSWRCGRPGTEGVWYKQCSSGRRLGPAASSEWTSDFDIICTRREGIGLDTGELLDSKLGDFHERNAVHIVM